MSGVLLDGDIENRSSMSYSSISKENLFIKTLENELEISHRYSDCNPMNCDGPPEVGCKIDGGPGGGLECRGDITDICIVEDANREAQSQGLGLVPLDLNFARDFRDDFLNNSAKGRTYVEYYYKINYVLQGMDFIKKVGLIEEFDLAHKLYLIAYNLRYAPNDQVILVYEDRNFLISFIDKMRSISGNVEFVSILDEITNDLILYTDKSKSEILVDFK